MGIGCSEENVKSSERLAHVSDWLSLSSIVTSVVSPLSLLLTTGVTEDHRGNSTAESQNPHPVAQNATRWGTRTT